jgi:isopenicillin N synthase-like dioxygenase
MEDAAKRAYEDLALKGQRGFTSFGREKAKDQKVADLKEFWHVGRDRADGLHNIWPTEVPSFKPVMLELFRQLDACAASLLHACALYLGEPENLMADMAESGDTILRVIHYPPVSDDRDPSSIRAAAHEDINFITLLCESTSAGLELLERDGSWRPIHALDGQIIVDSGDMIQQLTNGILRSTTHRVTNPSNDRDRRFSMPFFVHPRAEVDLTPLKSCVERVGETRYPAITAGEYLQQRLREIGLA